MATGAGLRPPVAPASSLPSELVAPAGLASDRQLSLCEFRLSRRAAPAGLALVPVRAPLFQQAGAAAQEQPLSATPQCGLARAAMSAAAKVAGPAARLVAQ